MHLQLTPVKAAHCRALSIVLAIVLMQLLFRTRSLRAMRSGCSCCSFTSGLHGHQGLPGGEEPGQGLARADDVQPARKQASRFRGFGLRNWFFAILLLPPALSLLRVTISLGMVAFAGLSLFIALQTAFGSGRRIGDRQANALVVEDRALRGA